MFLSLLHHDLSIERDTFRRSKERSDVGRRKTDEARVEAPC